MRVTELLVVPSHDPPHKILQSVITLTTLNVDSSQSFNIIGGIQLNIFSLLADIKRIVFPNLTQRSKSKVGWRKCH